MIILAAGDTTTLQWLSGSTVISSTVTDTLYVKSVRLDFQTGAIYATIARGTVVNGVFAENYPSVDIVVNPDGSFVSSDNKWKGNISSAGVLVSQLKTQFDQFILSAGLIAGTAVSD